jgi:hypothetical protein
MTREEFNNSDFGFGDLCKYQGEVYYVNAIDFSEDLLGIIMNIEGADEGDVTWVRCESVEFIKKEE